MALWGNTKTIDVPEPVRYELRPILKSAKLEKRAPNAKTDGYLAEYAELAAAIGVTPPDLGIETFKAFLVAHDLPVFSLVEVVKYMDEKAAKESKDKSGWHWRPLRMKDNREKMTFGRVASRNWNNSTQRDSDITPASDYYLGHEEIHRPEQWASGHGGWVVVSGQQQQPMPQPVLIPASTTVRPASSLPYDQTVPLHALRKVALIEREYKGGDVAFFVADYAPEPAVTPYPDPFLMAVIPNPKLARGEGRFVLDFWDEPGFGIDKMVK